MERPVARGVVFACASIALLLTAGCGGGGGSSPAPRVAVTPTPVGVSSAGNGTIALSIVVPAVSAAAKHRTPKYVSSSTYQAAIVVTPQGQPALPEQIIVCTVPSGGVGKVCGGTLSAPAGADSIAITLEDQPTAGNTDGNALSQGTTVAIVNAGQTSTINATLNGIVHNVAVAFASSQITYAPVLPYSNTQSTLTVPAYAAVNAYDADGNVITYNGGYVDANGNNVSIGLAASKLCSGNAACSVTLGATSVAGPGSLIPITATLSDQVSAFSEALTVTPSVLFGNPGGTLTAGTVHFVRPSTCAAYAPALVNAYPFTSTLSGYPYSEKLEITNPALSLLDPRIMLNVIFQTATSLSSTGGEVGVLTYQNPGPYAYSGVVKWQTPATSNSASTEFAQDGLSESNDFLNSGFYIRWSPPTSTTTIEADLSLALSAPAGMLCNDTAAVPTSFTPVDMYI